MKRLTAALLCLVLLCLLAACDKEPAPSLPSSTHNSPVSIPSPSQDDSSSCKEPSSSLLSSSESSDTLSSAEEPQSSSINSSSNLSGSVPEEEIITPEDPFLPESEHLSHYCYSKLTNIQKIYYDAMYNAVYNMQTTWIPLGKKEATYLSDVSVVRNALANDHPDLFWLPSYHATAIGASSSGDPTVLIYFATSSTSEPSYLVSRSEADIMKRQLEEAVTEILSSVTATDPYEIELQLHDMLCSRVEYSTDSTDGLIYSAYGALVGGKALCEGYSRAMQLLLSRKGIPTVTVTGVANNEGHMWNAVNLSDNWYHLDATWNDTKGDSLSHEYFNLSDNTILLDHTFSKDFSELSEKEHISGGVSFNIKRPICNDTTLNYFNRTGFIAYPDGAVALANYIVSTSTDTVEVRFCDQIFRDSVLENHEIYVGKISSTLREKYPDFKFNISGISVSTSVLRLYLKPIPQN